MGPGPRAPASAGSPRAWAFLAVLLLVPAAALAGCIAEPSTELTLRRGDLARLELVVWNGSRVLYPPNATGEGVEMLCGADPAEPGARCGPAEHAYALRSQQPATIPRGFAPATPLPDPVIEALSGLREGETRRLDDVLVHGPHRADLVKEHTIERGLTRFVDGEDAYGRAWTTTELRNGTLRIDPDRSDEGSTVEVPRWCNQRFCLFTSTLVGWNQTHLQVRHEAQEGQQVVVEELDTALTVKDVGQERFTVDGNHPLAGTAFRLFAHLVDARGPPEGTRRAPSFDLQTVDGSRVSLEGLLGRPVVVEFFATWCPSCIKNTEHLNAIEERFGDQVAIVSIGVDPWERPAAIQSFIRQNDVSWPVAVDEEGTVSQAYHVGSLSTEVIVSPSGAIVHRETGVADHERVREVLEGMLEASEPPSGPSAGGPAS